MINDLFQQGLSDYRGGRLQLAKAAFRQVLALEPTHAGVRHLLATLAHRSGQWEQAEVLVRGAIDSDGNEPNYHLHLASILRARGRWTAAEASYREALKLRADFHEALNGLGQTLFALGRHAEAEAPYREALRLRPAFPEALSGLGITLYVSGRVVEAEACCRAALRLRPEFQDALINLGTVQFGTGRAGEAEFSYREALRLGPAHLTALNNLGIVLCARGRQAEAEASYRQALLLEPASVEALGNLGIALAAQGRLAEAEASYQEALRLQPNHVRVRANRSMALLLGGQFEEGWREYEWRWKTHYLSARERGFSAPLWNGEALGDRVLLLHAEQGFGDTIQFCRYAPLAAARGGRVVLEVPPALLRLLSHLPGIEAIVARGDSLPKFDVRCPLLSLPRAFDTTLETIPVAIPYLKGDAVEIAAWRERLAHLKGLRVGLAWGGEPRTSAPEMASVDWRRSVSLEALAPLAIAGVDFVSLQKGSASTQAAAPPAGLALTDFTADLHDFAATAALMDNLDLVVSVDTSVAHLAGALGKPVWLLNRFDTCWRWLLEREDSPWYPTLRQFRQSSSGDWTGVIARVSEALRRLVDGERGELVPRPVAVPPATPPDALLQRAIAHHHAGRLAQAEKLCLDVVVRTPAQHEAWYLLGLVALQSARPLEAAERLRQAIALNGAQPNYHLALGLSLNGLGRHAEAEASMRAVLKLQPELAEAHNGLGALLSREGKPAEAEASFREALRCRPDFPDAHNNLGCMLFDLRRLAEAEVSHREALRLRPDFPAALDGLAKVLAELRRPAEAFAHWQEALRLQPEFADARQNRAIALLLAGRYEEGWQDFEWRWKTRYMLGRARSLPAPLWSGEALGEKVLLLYAEQGLGDTLQFCRYASLAAAQGVRVVLEVQAPLTRLVASLPGIEAIVAQGEPLPHFDVRCPLLSLPRAFGTTLETIPATVPYLQADAAEIAAWRERLAHLKGLRVGLAWAGAPRPHVPTFSAMDARRSLALHELAPLGQIPGLSLVSLQKGPAAVQAAAPPAGLALTDFTSELHDFATTAALIENLDLVVSVDTSVAHLAGALGKPVWLLNRFDTCWRWLLGREDSPWYPTLRQFRQPSPGNWAGVIQQVKGALQRRASG